MIYRTYEEWQKLECNVVKGETSHKRNEEGVCTFSVLQVEKSISKMRSTIKSLGNMLKKKKSYPDHYYENEAGVHDPNYFGMFSQY